MSLVVIRYFSGTGNTAWLAARIGEALERRGKRVSLANLALNEDSPHLPDETSLLILCYPVYALDAPPAMQGWARRLPDGQGRSVVVVRSPGDPFFDGGTTRTMRRILEERGWRVRLERMIVMPPNIFYRASDDLAALILAAARRRLVTLADDIVGEKELLEQTGFFVHHLSRLFNTLLGKNSFRFGRDLRVGDTCTRCGLCARECPAGNIAVTGDGVRFHDHCMVCLRCIARCPVHAIRPRWYRLCPVTPYDLAALDDAGPEGKRPRNWFERRYGNYLGPG